MAWLFFFKLGNLQISHQYLKTFHAVDLGLQLKMIPKAVAKEENLVMRSLKKKSHENKLNKGKERTRVFVRLTYIVIGIAMLFLS